ncbi:flavin monoamine oxidase family protein [Lignipirellula cremea]|uniref:Protoporphyrinogen oxidase n=1 Tax=Lignipirellula cremea TaxID=2528010 RepID=A0A518E4R0_9BACT|nr:FAD-dependent oxidoreductase [Lignipirellula cremea]QDU99069.1 protoporphyrinogen oxidase [Lignipirellula cremea]
MNGLTRRNLLQAFLGAPLALAAEGCRPGQATREPLATPPGKLIGASEWLGHLLRDRQGLDLTLQFEETRDDVEEPERFSTVIIGGGVAGLSAARRLLRDGVEDFLLLELESRVGGTAQGGSSQYGSFPWGAHYVPAPTRANPALIELLAELKVFDGVDEQGDPVVAEQYCCRYPQERVFYRGKWYDGLYLTVGASPGDLEQLQAFRDRVDGWIAWRDSQGRRAFTIPMAQASDDPEVLALDRMSMSEWLAQQGLDSSRLVWLVDNACRDDYGLTVAQTSAWAGLFYFAARTEEPGRESRPFITWPEGNGRIVHHLMRRCYAQIATGWAVADISPGEEGEPIQVLATRGGGGAMRRLLADKVIFAAPQFLAPFLIRPYRQQPPPHVAAFSYGAWAVVNLAVEAPWDDDESDLAWDNVLYESPSLGYIASGFQQGRDFGPMMLTYYYPLCEDDPRDARRRLLSVDREGWAEIALADLEVAHPRLRSRTLNIDVMRWGHAMIQPRPGFITSEHRQAAAAPYRGVHFAHSDLSGLPLFEEAFYRGTLAAEAVLEQLGLPVSSIL